MMFAAVAILALMGILASELLRRLHRRVVFWERPHGSSSAAG